MDISCVYTSEMMKILELVIRATNTYIYKADMVQQCISGKLLALLHALSQDSIALM